jgi:hypothetical protein
VILNFGDASAYVEVHVLNSSGAIFQSLSNRNIVNSIFSGNSAISEGGALRIYTNSSAEIINCLFE